MAHRTVVIQNPAYIYRLHDQLVVKQENAISGKVPIEDVVGLVLESHGISLSEDTIVALAERGAFVLHIDSKHLPIALTLPIHLPALHAKTLREQVLCSEPKKKQLWKQVVFHKLMNQAALLRQLDPKSRKAGEAIEIIESLALKVGSGDPSNCEAQAASIYFPTLFGSAFLRDREAEGVNAALNYGYAVIRAMIARSLVVAGLHCALGVHHRGPANPFNLADDAIEPLRPWVDNIVLQLQQEGLLESELDREVRRRLLEITKYAVVIAGKTIPIEVGLEMYAASWRRALCESARNLSIPSRKP